MAFCDAYCSSTNRWKIPIKETFNELFTNYNKCNKNVVAIYLKKLNYRDFLKTPYWKTISYEAKRRAEFKCSLCGSQDDLRTHHRDYKRHGKEIEYIDKDLIVLCNKCHEKFHDIIKDGNN